MVARGIRRLGPGVALLVVAPFALALSACGPETARQPSAPASAPAPVNASRAANVIDFRGVSGIAIGATLAELTGAGAVTTSGAGCGPAFASVGEASPVFDDGQLVLIWAYPPLHTPENVGVGSSIEDVRKAYPSLVEITPPAGSHLYPGLLVTGPDERAYLMLYEGNEVQKLIVGFEKYARMLLDTGFGSC